MARPVDHQKRRERRLQILDAAITCFAERGYERTTTAEICRTAGISSGTLFHQFPTKAAILTAIFIEDTAELEAYFGGLDPGADPVDGVLGYVDRAAREAADPRVPGLLAAVMGHAGDAEFAAALATNEATVHAGLVTLLTRARTERRIPRGMSADRLAGWVQLIVDGFYSRILADPTFDVATESTVLRDVVTQLLRQPAR